MMIRNATSGQLLELASALTKNLPKDLDGATATAWIGDPRALQGALRNMLMHGERSRITGIYFEGPNSYITQGREETLLRTDGWVIDAHLTDPGVIEFSIESCIGRTANWILTLSAPKGDTLSIGKYSEATRYPFQDPQKPGLCFSGCGRGNNTLIGDFDILEIEIQEGGLISFAADFIQFDECQAAKWARGSIRYNSSIPIAAFDRLP